MRAAFITALGPPTSIEVAELPTPQPGPTDLLVAVDLVAANPVDAYIRSGRYPTRLALPFVVGRDLVGTVVGAGPAAGWPTGAPVWCNSLGHDGRQGSFAEYAVVPAERCYPLPPGVEPATAVAVAHPAATAYLAWFVHARVRPGETVYVGGAGGADVVLDYRDPSLAEAVRAAAPKGVDAFWDTSGHHDLDLVAEVAAAGARVLLTAASVPRPNLPAAALHPRDVSLHAFVISRATAADLAAAAGAINDLLARGLLTARSPRRCR